MKFRIADRVIPRVDRETHQGVIPKGTTMQVCLLHPNGKIGCHCLNRTGKIDVVVLYREDELVKAEAGAYQLNLMEGEDDE